MTRSAVLTVNYIQNNPENTLAILESFEDATVISYESNKEVYIIEQLEADSTN